MDPPRPSTRLRDATTGHPRLQVTEDALRGDLDWIVMKAMEKDRTRRYETANGLAADIRRHLNDEPVEAAAPSALYRFRKFTRKHRTAFATATTIAALLAASTVVKSMLAANWKRGESEKSVALGEKTDALADRERALAAAKESNRGYQLKQVEEMFESGKSSLAVAHLVKLLRDDPNDQVAAARLVSALSRRRFPQLATEPLNYGEIEQRRAVLSADGSTIVTTSQFFALVWDAGTGHLRHLSSRGEKPLPGREVERPIDPNTINRNLYELRHADESMISAVAVSPDGSRVVLGSWNGSVQVWDARTGERIGGPLHNAPKNPTRIGDVRFGPRGRWFVTDDDLGQVRLWQFVTGSGSVSVERRLNLPHSARVDFSRDGRWLLVSKALQRKGPLAPLPEGPRPLKLLDLESGEWSEPIDHQTRITWVALSPDASRMASACWDGTVRIWDRATRQLACPVIRHGNRASYIEFSPDGSLLLSVGFDQTVRIWDVATGLPLGVPISPDQGVYDAKFSPDGTRVLTQSTDGYVHFWEVGTGAPIAPALVHSQPVSSAQFFPDGKRLMTTEWKGLTRIWKIEEVAPGARILNHPIYRTFTEGGAWVYEGTTSPGGKWMGTFKCTTEKFIRVWDASTGGLLGEFGHDFPGWNKGRIEYAFSADDQRVITWHSYPQELLDHQLSEDGRKPIPIGKAGTIRQFGVSDDQKWAFTISADSSPEEPGDWRERPCEIQAWDATVPGFVALGVPIPIEQGVRDAAISNRHGMLAIASHDQARPVRPPELSRLNLPRKGGCVGKRIGIRCDAAHEVRSGHERSNHRNRTLCRRRRDRQQPGAPARPDARHRGSRSR